MAIIWCKHVSNSNEIIATNKTNVNHIELHASNLINLPATDSQLIRTLTAELSLQPTSFTGLLPTEVIVTETGFNSYIWDVHTQKTLKLIAAMGATSVCMDNNSNPSGANTYLHWKYDDSGAKQQLIRYVNNTCRIAKKSNIKVLLEPLDNGFTNHLNSLQEVVDFIDLLNIPNLGLSINSQTLIKHDIACSYKKLWRVKLDNQELNNSLDLISKLTILNNNQHDVIVSIASDQDSNQINQLIQKVG